MEANQIDLTMIDPLLTRLWAQNGTDLLVTAGTPPRVRVDGRLRALPGIAVVDPEQAETLISTTIGPELRAQLHVDKEIDFSFTWGSEARFRGNCFFQQGVPAMALRAIPFYIPSFEELGLPAVMSHFGDLPQGLVLVTGPTGSGKSTTLASLLDYVNRTHELHILTIEDPIEYVHQHQRSAVNQREVGLDTNSFASALRAALREDPDVILVGEMRDLETIQFALTLAETGHLVFATLHTNDAAQAIDRISDVFPADRQEQIRVQLAASMAGVISQRLIPRTGGGQVAAFEILVANNAMRNLVREGKTHQIRNVVATGSKEGMRTLEMSLTELVAEGEVSYDDAVAQSLFPKEIRATGPAVTRAPIPTPAAS